jgi:hypothetical protein
MKGMKPASVNMFWSRRFPVLAPGKATCMAKSINMGQARATERCREISSQINILRVEFWPIYDKKPPMVAEFASTKATEKSNVTS